MRESLVYTYVETPVGELTVASSPHGLCLVAFGRRLLPAQAGAGTHQEKPIEWVEDSRGNQEARRQLQEYFKGRRRCFELALDLRGTPFQVQAWEALRRIPYGQTRTYRELAQAVGRPRAFRAAGLACRTNPLPIIVPCHRVIGRAGNLTGFGGGLDLKQRLLAHEARNGSRTLQGNPA